jgi:hypothetical protein
LKLLRATPSLERERWSTGTMQVENVGTIGRMTEVGIDMDEHEHVSIAPAWNRRGETFYYGPCMVPFFQPGDIMRLVPCTEVEIRRGDVIVFKPPGHDRLVVHRVIGTGPGGIRTRGDRNNQTDPWVLNGEHIRGRVVSLERGMGRYYVGGGLAGMFHASIIWGLQRLDCCISNILHPLYRRLSQMGVFRRLLPDSMAPRIVTFGRPDGTDMQILMGRQVIGRRVAGTGWVIKRPYRLFVDERSLPDCAGRPCHSQDR